MLIKVCGLTTSRQAKEIDQNNLAHFVGLIFYPGSKRATRGFNYLKTHSKKVGVFVNAEIDYIKACIEQFQLDLVQLHGQESPAYCSELRTLTPVIKAIPVGHFIENTHIENYKDAIDILLFDTETSSHGGSGISFDWNLLQAYQGDIPFLVGGGIGLSNVLQCLSIKHPKFLGIDINSQVELAPGVKNIEKIKEINKLIYT